VDDKVVDEELDGQGRKARVGVFRRICDSG
jgi:hypothetical protein